MRHARTILLLPLLLVLTQAPPALAQATDPDLRADIQHLFEVTNANQIAVQLSSAVYGQILDGMRRTQPSVPPRTLEIVKEVVDAEYGHAYNDPGGLTSQMIDVYARHFTREEIHGLVAFYSSDLGKKTISTFPAIIQESTVLAQRWSEAQMPRITATIQARLRAEGLAK